MVTPKETAKRDLLADAIAQHQGELTAFVRARLPAAEADDVLQKALLRATEKLDHLQNPEAIRGWLFRIVRNTLVDFTRARSSRREATLDDATLPSTLPGEPGGGCECGVHLKNVLPVGQARLLEMVDMGEATVPEAAESMAITSNNASVRLHRARKTLREKLLEHCGVSNLREAYDCSCADTQCSM